MKNHLTDGELRAALDGELDSDKLKHLDSCQQCQSRQKILEAQIGPTAERLRFLSSPTRDAGLSTASAWKKFNNETLAQKETSMFRKLFASPLVKYGASAALVIALILAFPATRALAGELLNLFRVQRVVEELGPRPVHEREGRRPAARRRLQERAVVHRGRRPQNRFTARLTTERAISRAASRTAVSSRAIVSATVPSTRKSACSRTPCRRSAVAW